MEEVCIRVSSSYLVCLYTLTLHRAILLCQLMTLNTLLGTWRISLLTSSVCKLFLEGLCNYWGRVTAIGGNGGLPQGCATRWSREMWLDDDDSFSLDSSFFRYFASFLVLKLLSKIVDFTDNFVKHRTAIEEWMCALYEWTINHHVTLTQTHSRHL